MQSPADLITTDIGEALDRLRAGGLVAIPTETVYGLAADAERADAVARIFAIKGRPTSHPLIVHVADQDHLEGWVQSMSDHAKTLAEVCWPGPLTMLLPRGRRVLDEVTGGRASVGVRVPSHPSTLELLTRFGGGVAAPSANRFGKVSPTTAEHVLDDLGALLDPSRDVILDGGACPVGVESTIIDLTVTPPQLLRAGAITGDDIARIIEIAIDKATGQSRASGMLASHYSPECTVLLVDDIGRANEALDQRSAGGQRVRILDRTNDLVVAARQLYNDLREADRAGLDALIVVMPPAAGIGHALRDRLTKAAAGG
jgi:L-threonylcarbamoyladenylate synthase